MLVARHFSGSCFLARYAAAWHVLQLFCNPSAVRLFFENRLAARSIPHEEHLLFFKNLPTIGLFRKLGDEFPGVRIVFNSADKNIVPALMVEIILLRQQLDQENVYNAGVGNVTFA